MLPVTTTNALADKLVEYISGHSRVAVAFSGGVDSSVVAAAAARANCESLIAITANSASVSKWQQELASTIAAEIGISHQIVSTNELQIDQYAKNDGQRCFFCKQTLYQAIESVARNAGGATIMSGTNADDLGDYRPGIEAGNIAGVVTPLADLGICKGDVRRLATHFGLSNAELPASPCLASRIAYGVEVTGERLARVESAESLLRDLGFTDLRVRVHENELARIEVPLQELGRLDTGMAQEIVQRFTEFGFRYVTLDLAGLRSGNLNLALVSIDTK